jgi:arylsulfatase A-like enzyme
MNAICLVVDRLHVGYLGCYGNSWIATPSFNRLAADGFVFDQALIESPDLARQYDSFAAGSHILDRMRGSSPEIDLVERLRAAGINTALLTDDPSVAEMAWAARVDEVVRVDLRRVAMPVADLHETNLARLFAVAGQWLESAAEPFCLWLHCGSLGASWDAPCEFRQSYRDEDDPPPLANAVVPSRLLAEDYDPDELLSVCQAYAGQVSLLDICLGALVEHLDAASAGDRTLLSVLSARGFSLGEHHRIGSVDDALFAELVHTPWILRLPDGCGASDRSQALVQPSDLAPTLIDWFGLPANDAATDGKSLLPCARGKAETLRDRAFIVGSGNERAVRTPAWHMRVPSHSPGDAAAKRSSTVELYSKPDDRWDVNDVADRCPEVVDLLVDVLDDATRTSQHGTRLPLAEVLLSGLH